jgi:hypothetical protein
VRSWLTGVGMAAGSQTQAEELRLAQGDVAALGLLPAQCAEVAGGTALLRRAEGWLLGRKVTGDAHVCAGALRRGSSTLSNLPNNTHGLHARMLVITID